MSRPRVLVTRDAGGCSRWSARLAELGAEPVSLPCLEHAVMPESELELRRALTTARWLVVTSARGVDAVAELLGGSGPVRTGEFLPPGVSVAAVGPTTASQALRVLGRVDLVPPTPNASTLAEALWSTADADLGPAAVGGGDHN
ncbi:MAG: uroporphyrinogen-III synthase, partial [Acidobacteriota bacterium]